MLRRNFFATLLAPIVARLWPKPKPKPVGESVFWLGGDGLYRWTDSHPKGEIISVDITELFNAYYTNERRLKILGPDGPKEDDFA